MTAVGIIPARYASSRFPGKPLVDLGGKPLIQWTWEAARRCDTLSRVLVATDDDRIADAVAAFGGEVVMTRPDHVSGTDRLAEVAAGLQADVVVNIQGDEPFLESATIDAVARPMMASGAPFAMSTACVVTRDPAQAEDPNVVKVVTAKDGAALYFSRAPIPYYRDAGSERCWRLHLGLYAYRRDFLPRFTAWPPTALERAESLEQLRALEHGARILVVEVPERALGVDTPADLDRARALLRGR